MSEKLKNRIVYFRKLAGYTQSSFAEQLNLKTGTYAKREINGNFSIETLEQIAEILDIELVDLLTDQNSENSKIVKRTPTDKIKLTCLEESIVNTLRYIPYERKEALLKLITLVSKNKKLDIKSEVKRIENTLKI